MRKKIDKSKLTIIILSVVLALSLSVTIVFAAFTANKSSTVTISFDNGLTMRLEPLGTNGRIQFVTANENATSFTYSPATNLDNSVALDGMDATLNKPAWIALKVEFWETTSGSDVAPVGNGFALSQNSNTYFCHFRTKNNGWYAEMVKTGTTFTYALTASPNIFTSTSTAACAADTKIRLFDRISIWGMLLSSERNYCNQLAGRSFKFVITIKARTDQAPTF